MRQRTRKFWGTIILFALVIVWALLGMLIATFGALHDASGALEFALYLVVGVGWVLPAGAIVWWMAQPDPEP